MPVNYARATPRRTPAHILYQVMSRALDDVHGPYLGTTQSMAWGLNRGYGISRHEVDAAGKPIIQFGVWWHDASPAYPLIYLRADGWFRLGHLHGWTSRSVLAKNTFLEWEWDYSAYHWFYDPDRAGYRNYRNGVIKDLHQKRAYVAERMLRRNIWNTIGKLGWVRLKPNSDDVNGWEIVHAEDAYDQNGLMVGYTEAAFKKFAALRAKRYQRLQKQKDIELGIRDSRGRLVKKINQERPEAAKELSAHFIVSAAARTTPLRRK